MASEFILGSGGVYKSGENKTAVNIPSSTAPSVTYNITFNPPQPVQTIYDPKIDANALYGKPMVLSALGKARIGSAPAPIVGPYINAGVVDFIVSFGVPADPNGTRVIYAIYLDNELAWSAPAGGTLPAHGTFASEAFDFTFKQGRLDQTVCSLESERFPTEAIAYRPQMLLEIRRLPYQRFVEKTNKPVPYVALDIGDTTGGADPDDGITVGQGYEKIAYSPFVGWDSTKLDTTNVDDVCGGYLLKDNINIVQLGQVLAQGYCNYNLMQSDKVWLTDRGSNVTPDIVFNRDTIISPIGITRTEPSKQSREYELRAIDPDQDYTEGVSLSKRARDPVVVSASVGKSSISLPVILDASTRQALVTYGQFHNENARKRISLKSMFFGYEIEPGDLFATQDLADGINNEVWRVTETLHGANWVVEIEAEALLRCSIYGEDFDPFLAFVALLIGPTGADGSTSFIDESPSLKTLAAFGTAEVDTAQSKYGGRAVLCTPTGTDGGAVGLIGTADTDFILPASFTFEGWYRFAAVTGDQGLFGTWNPPTNGYLLRYTAGSLDWLCFGGTNVSAAWSPVVDTWYHVAVDRDGTTLRLYIDGVKVASTTGVQNGTHAEPFGVGQMNNAGGRPFDGWWNEFRYTHGIARYATDTSFPVPTAAFPRV